MRAQSDVTSSKLRSYKFILLGATYVMYPQGMLVSLNGILKSIYDRFKINVKPVYDVPAFH